MKWTLVLLLSGCACCGAYKQAVTTYSAHQVEYARDIGTCSPDDAGQYSEDCIRDYVFPMSGLQCLVDEDQDTPDSRACKCSRAPDDATRATACAAWLKEGN